MTDGLSPALTARSAVTTVPALPEGQDRAVPAKGA